jgi:hypothetical protein
LDSILTAPPRRAGLELPTLLVAVHFDLTGNHCTRSILHTDATLQQPMIQRLREREHECRAAGTGRRPDAPLLWIR